MSQNIEKFLIDFLTWSQEAKEAYTEVPPQQCPRCFQCRESCGPRDEEGQCVNFVVCGPTPCEDPCPACLYWRDYCGTLSLAIANIIEKIG